MIQKKRLTAFYVEQYTKASKKRPRKMPGTNEMLYKTEKLFRLLENTKSSRVNIRSLEEYHRQLKNVVMFARRKNRDDILEKLNTVILPRLAELDLGLLLDEQKKGMTEDFLVWLQQRTSLCGLPGNFVYPVSCVPAAYSERSDHGSGTGASGDGVPGSTGVAPAFYSAHRTNQQRKDVPVTGTAEAGRKRRLSGTITSARAGSI